LEFGADLFKAEDKKNTLPVPMIINRTDAASTALRLSAGP